MRIAVAALLAATACATNQAEVADTPPASAQEPATDNECGILERQMVEPPIWVRGQVVVMESYTYDGRALPLLVMSGARRPNGGRFSTSDPVRLHFVCPHPPAVRFSSAGVQRIELHAVPVGARVEVLVTPSPPLTGNAAGAFRLRVLQ